MQSSCELTSVIRREVFGGGQGTGSHTAPRFRRDNDWKQHRRISNVSRVHTWFGPVPHFYSFVLIDSLGSTLVLIVLRRTGAWGLPVVGPTQLKGWDQDQDGPR